MRCCALIYSPNDMIYENYSVEIQCILCRKKYVTKNFRCVFMMFRKEKKARSYTKWNRIDDFPKNKGSTHHTVFDFVFTLRSSKLQTTTVTNNLFSIQWYGFRVPFSTKIQSKYQKPYQMSNHFEYNGNDAKYHIVPIQLPIELVSAKWLWRECEWVSDCVRLLFRMPSMCAAFIQWPIK